MTARRSIPALRLPVLGGLLLAASSCGPAEPSPAPAQDPAAATPAAESTSDTPDLTDSVVTRVVSDDVFYVTPAGSPASEFLVYVNRVVSDEPLEPGNHIRILDGTLRPVPADEGLAWGLTNGQYGALGAEPQVLETNAWQPLGATTAGRTRTDDL